MGLKTDSYIFWVEIFKIKTFPVGTESGQDFSQTCWDQSILLDICNQQSINQYIKTTKYLIFQIWLKNGKRALDIDYYKDKQLADIVQLDDQVILDNLYYLTRSQLWEMTMIQILQFLLENQICQLIKQYQIKFNIYYISLFHHL